MSADNDFTSTDTKNNGSETVVGSLAFVQGEVGKNLPFLSIIYPQKNKSTFPITKKKQILRRGQHVAIVLDDEMASREHCQYWLGNDSVIVELGLYYLQTFYFFTGSKVQARFRQHFL